VELKSRIKILQHKPKKASAHTPKTEKKARDFTQGANPMQILLSVCFKTLSVAHVCTSRVSNSPFISPGLTLLCLAHSRNQTPRTRQWSQLVMMLQYAITVNAYVSREAYLTPLSKSALEKISSNGFSRFIVPRSTKRSHGATCDCSVLWHVRYQAKIHSISPL